MAMIRSHSLVFSAFSLLMGLLFAYSASVQFNDPDWYFWLPLYVLASGVNLLQVGITSKGISQVAVIVFWGGVFLFGKVIVEGHVLGLAGIWSLDMRERVVREKLGSGLVALSMLLQVKSSRAANEKKKKKGKREQAARFVEYGMAMLVALSFGLSMYFFAFVADEMF